MEVKEQRHFFVMLKELYINLPPKFTSKITFEKSKKNKQPGFYRYVQDEREKQGADNSHLKDVEDSKEFFREFYGFVYVHVFGHYYELDEVVKLKAEFEVKFKNLLT